MHLRMLTMLISTLAELHILVSLMVGSKTRSERYLAWWLGLERMLRHNCGKMDTLYLKPQYRLKVCYYNRVITVL